MIPPRRTRVTLIQPSMFRLIRPLPDLKMGPVLLAKRFLRSPSKSWHRLPPRGSSFFRFGGMERRWYDGSGGTLSS